MDYLITIISWSYLLSVVFGQADRVIRNTSSGKVNGTAQAVGLVTVERYLGIPFASPPVGDLRWKAPEAHPGWANTDQEPLDASQYGAECSQFSAAGIIGEEDCLFLNVFVPRINSSDLKPVMVFVHGGSFIVGSSNLYDHSILSSVGDVIGVTINYRLGVFGFMSTGDSQATGNYGLLDQMFALKWVQENIENFGGDKSRVTIFGESAGAASVLMQAMSPMNNQEPQLFHRIIAESGSPFGVWAFVTQPGYWAEYILEASSCPTFSFAVGLQCLRKVNSNAILINTLGIGAYPNVDLPFVPSNDGSFLTDNPKIMASSTNYLDQMKNRYDFMIGVNDFDVLGVNIISLLNNEKDFLDYLNISLGRYYADPYKAVQAIFYNYIDWDTYPPTDPDVWKLLASDVTRDFLFLVPSLNFSNLASAEDGFNSSVYFYYYIQRPTQDSAIAFPRTGATAWVDGAAHADELEFVFGLPLISPNTTDVEKKLSLEVMTYWTNFAKSGNPNTGGAVPTEWPKYNSLDSEFIILGSKSENESTTSTGDHLSTDKVVFWTDESKLLNLGEPDNNVVLPSDNEADLPDAVVTTDKGVVIGRHIQTSEYLVDRFLGIPFAKPPVGQLRFRPPQPHPGWDEPLRCDGEISTTEWLNGCVIENSYQNGTWGSEDCLYLNVWVPGGINGTRDQLLPVMAWIYEGAFVTGTSTGTTFFYDMEKMVAQGNVIGVSLNYRLGPLGFLSTADENAPGNAGFLDQVAALQWIQNNIAKFGGDPNQVTIFGEFAGAASVSYHMLSPVSENLFLRGIAQSGVPPAQWTLQRAPLFWAQTLATSMNCPTSNTKLLVGCLRTKSADEMFRAVTKLDPLHHGGRLNFPWVGVVDGYFIVQNPIITLSESKDKDLLLGHNSMDGHMFASLDFDNLDSPGPLSRDDVRRASQIFTPYVPPVISETTSFIYIEWEEPESDELWPKLAIVNLYTDTLFVITSYWTANERVAANGNGRTYMYRFSEKSPSLNDDTGYPDWVEADHAMELFYLFGHDHEHRFTESDRKLSLAMMTYWTNFAWSGNPNQPNQADLHSEWPEYKLETKYAIELNSSTVADQETNNNIISNYRGDYVQFWSRLANQLWALDLVPCLTQSYNTSNTSLAIIQDNPAICPNEPFVRATHAGCVRGYEYDWNGTIVERYLGIPYAAPPIAGLRFENPENVASWQDVRSATEFSKICPQGSTFDDASMSEDCLYLCVYVPRNDGAAEGSVANMPVMVWIHGGGFQNGDGMGELKVDPLSVLGDVIVVTLNYRLGSFGFMTTDDDASRGNYGLLDQQIALQWVKTNIRNFGGDPDSITLFGQSAGGQSVSLQTMSPINDNLNINRAIMESPSIVPRNDLRQLDSATQLANTSTCDINSGNEVMVSCLKSLNTAALLQAQHSTGLSFLPTVDGTFLPDHPDTLVDRTRVQMTSYLLGINSGDGSVRWNEVQTAVDRESFHEVIRNRFQQQYGWRQSLIDQEYSDYNDLDFFNDQQEMQIRLTTMFGDERYAASTCKMADDYSEIGSNVFFYYFTYPHQKTEFNGFPVWAGAAHSSELSFVFGEVLDEENQTGEVKELSRTMIKYWSNFAKYGDPNGESDSSSLINWPKYNSTVPAVDRQHLRLDLGNLSTAGSDLKLRAKAFWNELMVSQSASCEDDSQPITDPPSPTPDPSSPQVQTTTGPVLGKRVQNQLFDVDVFLGIPYAKSPTGNLRFSNAEPVQEWTSTLDATTPKAPCLQADRGGNVIGDEDCLYLDIFTPSGVIHSNSAEMPVMIWIHGDANGQNPDVLSGSFWSGGGSPGWQGSTFSSIDPSFLSNLGNVMIVRPNFRIGAFGFLTTESETISGNYGLSDLIQVIEWVNRNAENFGGNKNTTTLFGQGSGGALAELLAGISSTGEYVKRVITSSGSARSPWVFCPETNYCQGIANSIASASGCENTDEQAMLSCLRSADAMDIIRAMPRTSITALANQEVYNAWGTWRLWKDGNLIPNSDMDLLANATAHLISGTTSHEFFRYIEAAYPQDISRASTSTTLSRAIYDTERFLPGQNIESWSSEVYSILNHNYINWNDPNNQDLNRESSVKYYTDLMFAVDSSDSLRSKAEQGMGTSYQYVITRPLKTTDLATPSWVGGRHGDDVTYIFGYPYINESEYTDEDRDFSSGIMNYWINFALTG